MTVKSYWRYILLFVFALVVIYCYARGFFTGALVFILAAMVLEMLFWTGFFSHRFRGKKRQGNKNGLS
ncbi:MAG: hypothetical protein CL595_14075 [Alteromonas sp.]|nr:hypothetical protein [Alteromonas sp.]|tara:strand:+ start:5201 stop:5404 length:204 start_codon:yes stop_codon:yes gene_type:complete